MNDEIFIDEDGRFQMPADKLPEFVAFLKDNKILCDVEDATTFRAEGHTYSFGRLRHAYDIEAAEDLYQSWRRQMEPGLLET